MSIETVDDLSGLLGEPTPLSLELTSYCDQCGFSGGEPIAQALVAVRLKSGGELNLCGHHYTKNELALSTVAIQVLDRRGSVS